MFSRISICSAVMISTSMLLSCGGSGDGNSFSPTNQSSGGIWLGNWTGLPDGEEGALALSTNVDTDTGQARFNFFLFPARILIAVTAQVDGTLITGSGTAYTITPGDFFTGGGSTTGVTFSGTLSERNTLVADWAIDAGEAGSFSLAYDNQHLRGADLDRLNGLWTLHDLDDNPMGTFDILDGTTFRQTADCTSMGTITIPDPQFNIYAWSATVTSNTPGSCFIAGEYTGLGALTDAEDGSPVPLNDEFDVLVNSPTLATPLILVLE